MTSRNFLWVSTGGGTWSLASNWNDTTDGMDPSQLVPGMQDSVTIGGPTGTGNEIITGPGFAASAMFTGNSTLSGTFGFGSLSMGGDGNGGLFGIASAGVVTAGQATLATGSVVVNGSGSRLVVSGGITLGTGQAGLGAASCLVDATGGGYIQAMGLALDASSAHIYVDPTSIVEIGQAGGAQAGRLTIDPGMRLAGFGDANGYGATTNNGTIAAVGGLLLVGNLAGTGTLEIDAGATLDLNGTSGAGQSVVFAGANATLAIAAEHDAPAGKVAGFVPGDAIDVLGSPISSAIYAPTGSGIGLLTLTYGGQIAFTMTLVGDYSNDVFLTSGDGRQGTLVTVAPGGGGGGGLSGGTANPDVYTWLAPGSGRWNQAVNWQDVTTGKSPAKVAPGVNNLVSVAAPVASFDVIAGPGNAATFGVTGELALAGAFAFGTCTIGTAAGVAAVLDLLPGTTVSAGTATIADGSLSVSGAGSAFLVAGSLTLGGGAVGVGLPTTMLSAVAGGRIQVAGGLVIGGGSGNWITTDPTGIIEVGSAGGAVAGAVTVDAGSTLIGNGTINPFGSLVDNGTITASGGTLTLGAVTGSGALTIAGGATLDLVSTTALGITMTGPAATLALASEIAVPTGLVAGLVPGCVIDMLGDEIDTAAFARDQSGTWGTLSLFYGTTKVASFKLTGSFVNQHFLTASDGNGGTDILVSNYGGGGGGGGGQGNTDLLAWTQPVSGAWSNARNWFDVTTNVASKTAPGVQNAVLIAGPGGSSFQTVGGPGLCASLTFTGNTLLAYGFVTGTWQIGATQTDGSISAGFVELNGATSVAASQALILSGTMLAAGSGVSVSVTGTLTAGSAAGAAVDIEAQSRASIVLGGLVLAGGSIETDTTAIIEIGNTGSSAVGAVTLDAGSFVSGTGSLNANGTVIDNGVIAVAGGVLTVGDVSGTGMLAIGVEAVLVLAGTESCPITFAGGNGAGGGGTLLLAGSSLTPSGVIAGFAAGDSIIVGSSQISSVSWQPGVGGVGTLVLNYGDQIAGRLLLAGDYTGQTFSVQPSDAGAQITVQPWNGSGPSPGTPTPDIYVWTGSLNTSWNNAANWTDVTTGQAPALVAPGQHNLVTITGPVSGYQQVTGPADAASLTLLGQVSLGAQYFVGALNIGSAGSVGLLALGFGADVEAASALVTGGILLGGGRLGIGGALSLGGSGDGVLLANSGSVVTAGSLILGSPGSAVIVDATSSLEIGGNRDGTFTHGTTGTITIDAGGLLAGQGSIGVGGTTIDNGTIAVAGGTLSVGDVTGSGTLLVGVGATLLLDGTIGAGLTIDFTAAGTLTLAQGMSAAAIADFGSGDQILLPESGATEATYAQTGAGVGVLTVFSGAAVLARLTLLGIAAGAVFSVGAGANGGTVLTVTPGYDGSGNGGGTMGNGSITGPTDPVLFIASLPGYAQYWLGQSIGEGTSNLLTPYVWASSDGSDFGDAVAIYANIGVVTAPVNGSLVAIPAGYKALVAEGNASIGLADFNVGGPGVTLVGNMGQDTIVGADHDTLVGALGANTVFAVNTTVTIQGGGNDLYNTGQGAVTIITSSGHSVVALGGSQNLVTTYGNDTIACQGSGSTSDTIDASHSRNSPVIFGPSAGQIVVEGGAGAMTVVGGAGQAFVIGGSGGDAFHPNVLWFTSGFSSYMPGSGASAVIGGSGDLQVGFADPKMQAGTGPVTVYGGTGQAHIEGAAGNSTFLVGSGASTVHAGAGNSVYVSGAANVSVSGSGNGVFVWAAGSTGNNILQSGSGYETLVGGAGSDVFQIGNGQGLFEGLGGADVFGFSNGGSGGSATIYDFNTTNDHIGLHGYAGGAGAVLATATVSGGSTMLTLGDGTHVTLLGVTNLSASAFLVS